jgi:hypothetical protein
MRSFCVDLRQMEVLLDGREALLAMLQEPASVTVTVEGWSPSSFL